MANDKYFNIPIQLLEGFLVDKKNCLSNIIYYALYAHSLKLEHGNFTNKFISAADFYDVNLASDIKDKKARHDAIVKKYIIGEELYNSISLSSPKVGINIKLFWEYYDNEKPEFDKACLLAYLAIKSILGTKSYCKIDNRFLLSRMDGKPCSCEFDELTKEVLKYANEYQTKKIKRALQDGWGLVTYSRYTRGFYVTFTMDLKELIFQAEKKRASYKEKQRKALENEALKEALERLENLKSQTRA